MTAKQHGEPRHRHHRIYDRTSHRLREIERIIVHRYGSVPDTDDAAIILDQVACCYLHMLRKRIGRLPELVDLADRLKLWCERWAPHAPILMCRRVAEEALRRPRLDCADDCAARLRLSYEERTLFHITTIGAFDVSKRERTKRRKARKLIRDRTRAAKKRAERGVTPRTQYEANSLSRAKPWTLEGIFAAHGSVADERPSGTRHQNRGTINASPSSTSTASMLGDTLASPVTHVDAIGSTLISGPLFLYVQLF